MLSGYSVQLQFEGDFDIETHSNCGYDHLIIYEGTDDTAPLLAKLCGTGVSVSAIPVRQLLFLGTVSHKRLRFFSGLNHFRQALLIELCSEEANPFLNG